MSAVPNSFCVLKPFFQSGMTVLKYISENKQAHAFSVIGTRLVQFQNFAIYKSTSILPVGNRIKVFKSLL